jgi:hypothetical protein
MPHELNFPQKTFDGLLQAVRGALKSSPRVFKTVNPVSQILNELPKPLSLATDALGRSKSVCRPPYMMPFALPPADR